MSNDTGYRRHVRLYASGLLLAVTLTLLPTALVHWSLLAATPARLWVLAFSLLQILVHLRCFLGIGLRRSVREKTALLALAVVVIVLMVGGTLTVFMDQMGRM